MGNTCIEKLVVEHYIKFFNIFCDVVKLLLVKNQRKISIISYTVSIL